MTLADPVDGRTHTRSGRGACGHAVTPSPVGSGSTPPRGLVRPVALDPLGVTGPTRGAARGARGAGRARAATSPRPPTATARAARRGAGGPAATRRGGHRVGGVPAARGRVLRRPAHRRRTRLPVPLVTGGAHVRDDAGSARAAGRHRRLRGGDPARLPTARVERALFDAMRAVPLREAVVAMDMAAAADLVSVRRMRAYVATRAGCRACDAWRPPSTSPASSAGHRTRPGCDCSGRWTRGSPGPGQPAGLRPGRAAARHRGPARRRGRAGGRVRRSGPPGRGAARRRCRAGGRAASRRAGGLPRDRTRPPVTRTGWSGGCSPPGPGRGGSHGGARRWSVTPPPGGRSAHPGRAARPPRRPAVAARHR